MTVRGWGSKETAYAPEVLAAAKRHPLVPEKRIRAVMAKESGFDAAAIGDSGRSYGLGQIQLATAQGLLADAGVRVTLTPAMLMDPPTNIEVIAALLEAGLLRAKGNWSAVHAAYNGGWSRHVPSDGQRIGRDTTTKWVGGRPVPATAADNGKYENQEYVDLVNSFAEYFGARPLPTSAIDQARAPLVRIPAAKGTLALAGIGSWLAAALGLGLLGAAIAHKDPAAA